MASPTLYPSRYLPAGGATIRSRDSAGEYAQAAVPGTPITGLTEERALALMSTDLVSMIPSIEVYGHSWPNGYGASDPSRDFISILAQRLGGPQQNRATMNGGIAVAPRAFGGPAHLLQNAPATTLTAGPYVTKGGLKVVMIGGNDGSASPAYDATGQAMVESSMTVAYSRLLAARVVNPLNSGSATKNTTEVTFTGTWTALADTTISSGLGFAYTAINGNSVTIALDAAYAGEAITVLAPIGNVGTYTATVTADGGGTLASLNVGPYTAILATHSNPGTVLCLRLPAGTLSPGAHNLTITYTAIGGGGSGSFGGIIIEGRQPPPLLIPKLPYLSGDATFNAKADFEDARVRNIVGGFPSAIRVNLNPVTSPGYPNPDAERWTSAPLTTGHLTDAGHERVGDLLADVAQAAVTETVAALMA